VQWRAPVQWMSSPRGQYLPPQRSRDCAVSDRVQEYGLSLPPSSWTSVLRIGSLCPGLGLSCVTSVRGDERSWLALGARVTINRNCSQNAGLGENRTRSGGGGPLQAHRWHRRHHRGQYCTAALVETRSTQSIGYCSLLFLGCPTTIPIPTPSNRRSETIPRISRRPGFARAVKL
jgi:hypothetical protein